MDEEVVDGMAELRERIWRGAEEALDLGKIAGSGQCFRMEKREDGGYVILAGERRAEVWEENGGIWISCGKEELEGFWKNYFDGGTDYGKMLERIDPEDAYLVRAAAFGRGIRILRQDVWEMLITFLITQQNNIPRIKKCIEGLCSRYGRRLEGGAFFGFPGAEALAGAGEEELRECGLGYRSKYISQAARGVAEGKIDLEGMRGMEYPRAREELLKIYGVGEKVADCICLFGLHRLEAFPVDTHIRQALEAHYPQGFPVKRYEGIQGLMQQYMFYYHLNGEGPLPRRHGR